MGSITRRWRRAARIMAPLVCVRTITRTITVRLYLIPMDTTSRLSATRRLKTILSRARLHPSFGPRRGVFVPTQRRWIDLWKIKASDKIRAIEVLAKVHGWNATEKVGAILIYRQQVRPFADKQIELVKNFAAHGEVV